MLFHIPPDKSFLFFTVSFIVFRRTAFPLVVTAGQTLLIFTVPAAGRYCPDFHNKDFVIYAVSKIYMFNAAVKINQRICG
jgi:hypothetical protein